MSITIADYVFDGPYATTAGLKDQSGVYAILAQDARNPNSYSLLDVGESATVKSRVDSHDRKPCWQRHADGRKLYCAVHYTVGAQQAQRMVIEQHIRRQFIPPCGDR